MNYRSLIAVCAVTIGVQSAPGFAQIDLGTDTFRISISDKGQVTSLYDKVNQHEYLAAEQPAPLLQIGSAGILLPADSMTTAGKSSLILHFPWRIDAHIQVKRRMSHIVFTLVSVNKPDVVDKVIWGPYPTSIGRTVGEFVGVVRDGSFAIGIQSLNPKTVGGYPINEEGAVFSRGITAEKKGFGSVLQAFSLNRSKPRKIMVLALGEGSFPDMPVPPIKGETVEGSSIALFGVPEADALNTIGRIEIAEGLPHPEINGEWIKTSPETGRSYLIASFTETTIDTLLNCAERAGLMSLYHGHPFKTWGHFELIPEEFPHGYAGMKRCVEKAEARGMRLGAHVLSNFITTNDPFVTPVPDPRLALTGTGILEEDIDASDTVIPVSTNEYFNNTRANWLHSVRIGKEIIRYRTVTAEPPYRLLDCLRGAFGTTPSMHRKGETVGKLLDHAYKVFFPNWEMQKDLGKNLARFFNETGVSQMDFDGHEGCYATGQGDYAMSRFAKDFYDSVDHVVVNGSSRSNHYYWHINHYLNWGEPWYGGFRESMQTYRINNQDLLSRNFMPNMLGWYLLTPTTSLAEMEWMLARAAGYSAGFAMATSIEAVRQNKELNALLDAIREWETARRAGAFSPEQRDRLKESKNEFHLEAAAEGVWLLHQYYIQEYTYTHVTRQPGEPEGETWTFENPHKAQPPVITVIADGDTGAVVNPQFEVDNYVTIVLPVTLTAGESLASEGASTIRVYDVKGRQRRMVSLEQPLPEMQTGEHSVTFTCGFSGRVKPSVLVQLKVPGPGERVSADR